jgi:hypothetical protein
MADPKTPFSVVVTGPRILFAYQWNRLVRIVEMGPSREVIGPTYFGQNAGHWEDRAWSSTCRAPFERGA